jgi:tRNA(Ile)-lysidine synthetase-like protein
MRGAQPLRGLELEFAERVSAQPGEVLVAAVSGGPDSAALAALLAGCAAGSGARAVLAHVNHGIRESAWQDEAVALAIAAALDLRAVVRAAQVHAGSERALREARYAALAEIARETGAARVFAAHHAGDQTESVLLALFRGTGLAGAAGMPEHRALAEGLELHRPLLRRSRQELIAYAASRRLPYALDPTNADTYYRRNAVRAALVPLREAFPGLDEAVARFAEIAAGEGGQRGRRARLRALLRERIDGMADTENMSFERLDAAARAVELGHQGRIHLAPGVEIRLRGGQIPAWEASKEESPHLAGGSACHSDATFGRK